MDLQMDYADLCVTLLEKFGDDPSIPRSARMLLEYAAVRLAKIGISLGNPALTSGKNVSWEAILEKFSKKVLADREETTGETTRMIWPFHPAAAWLCARGKADIADAVTAAADKLIAEGHRNEDGLFDSPVDPGQLSTEILAMTVPLLAWAGKISGEKRYFDEAVKQFNGYAAKLFDPAARLWHPGYLPGPATGIMAHRWMTQSWFSSNFSLPNPGVLSGCWGRGEGYALFALSELIFELPNESEDKEKLIKARVDMLEGLLAYQDPDGMWHQVLNDWGSYPETSGTAWILYAIGRGIKKGTIDRNRFLSPYLRGLAGMVRYIAYDGTVFNGSVPCFCPGGRGTAVDFALVEWKKNESHTIAPVLLALQQAFQNECAKHLIPSFSEVLNQISGE